MDEEHTKRKIRLTNSLRGVSFICTSRNSGSSVCYNYVLKKRERYEKDKINNSDRIQRRYL